MTTRQQVLSLLVGPASAGRCYPRSSTSSAVVVHNAAGTACNAAVRCLSRGAGARDYYPPRLTGAANPVSPSLNYSSGSASLRSRRLVLRHRVCELGFGVLWLPVERLRVSAGGAVMDAEKRRGQQQGEGENANAAAASRVVGEVREAFKSGRTKAKAWRVEQLNGILRMVAEREAEIAAALFEDLGKPAHEAFVSELAQIRDSCKLAIRELKKWMAPVKVPGSLATYPSSAAIVAEPLGVTLVISAWNFPFLLSMDPLIGAISAGCGVVLKPSEVAPAMSAVLATLIPLYLDSSLIRVVEGGVPETAALLEQKWDKIFYTGNPRVGRIVMAAASKHLTPVTLELGGKCPAYIDSSADLKVTLRRIAYGKWGNNNGQACISPDYLLVDDGIASEVVSGLKQTIVKFFGEDPKTSQDLSRVVNASHFARLTGLLDDARTAATIVHGGERDEKNLYIAPTVLCDVPMDVPIMAEEIFGPILPIIKVKGVQEAIDIINERPKPLAAYVFTKNKEVAQQMVADVSSGGMVVNDTVVHFLVRGLPFGGVGESGVGAYHGKFSFDAFSHKKAVLYRKFAVDVDMRYPPYTSKKKNLLKSVLSGDFVGAALFLAGLKK